MPCSTLVFLRLSLLGSFVIASLTAAESTSSDLERKFSQTVRPFVTTYCIGCHSGKVPAAQFDLAPYSTMTAVVNDYGHWNLVLDKLTAKQMPPKGVPQPTEAPAQQ